jgi:hypothetical protein
MTQNSEVPIHFDEIYWSIFPIIKKEPETGKTLIELQWGWTAGMSEAELKNIAEDAPTGYDKVTTTLEMAKELRDKLTEIIELYKPLTEEEKQLLLDNGWAFAGKEYVYLPDDYDGCFAEGVEQIRRFILPDFKKKQKESFPAAESVMLFCGNNQQDNEAAMSELKRLAIKVNTTDSKILENCVNLPFVETNFGQRHYGLESIKQFVNSHHTRDIYYDDPCGMGD